VFKKINVFLNCLYKIIFCGKSNAPTHRNPPTPAVIVGDCRAHKIIMNRIEHRELLRRNVGIF
jgi:hypothetical protein